MKEGYIKNKVIKLMGFTKKNKNIVDLERMHAIGRIINRTNVVISEATFKFESHILDSVKQIIKEELK
jgi:hypothetical protein